MRLYATGRVNDHGRQTGAPRERAKAVIVAGGVDLESRRVRVEQQFPLAFGELRNSQCVSPQVRVNRC